MFVLNVFVQGAAGQVALFYESENQASKTAESIFQTKEIHDQIILVDQRGHQLFCRPRDVLFATVIDMQKDVAHQGDVQLFQAKEQMKFDAKVRADPSLRFLSGLNGAQSAAFQRQ